MTPSPHSISVLGVPVGAYTMTTLLDGIAQLVEAPGCAVAIAVNAQSLNLTYRYPAYLRALQKADLVYVDGVSIQLAARVLGSYLPAKLTPPDIWPHLCVRARTKGFRVFLLGGESGLADRVAAKTLAQYPNLHIVGTHHGYFELSDESILSVINAARPDILIVGMGDPRQVLWAASVKARLQAGLILTCGGMFKILAGDITRVPAWWCDRGFEWVYRLIQEPWTWRRYILGLPVFAARVFAQYLFGHRASPPETARR